MLRSCARVIRTEFPHENAAWSVQIGPLDELLLDLHMMRTATPRKVYDRHVERRLKDTVRMRALRAAEGTMRL
jgi:hypothetical protein